MKMRPAIIALFAILIIILGIVSLSYYDVNNMLKPAFKGSKVRVRISGIAYSFRYDSSMRFVILYSMYFGGSNESIENIGWSLWPFRRVYIAIG